MKKYYFYDGTTQYGPFTLEELQTKKITARTSVWFDPMPQWKSAGEIEELKNMFNNPVGPPPVPVVTTLPKEESGSNKFYFLRDLTGAQYGPFKLEQLKEKHITPGTPIWYDPLPEWTTAGEIAALKDIIDTTKNPEPTPAITISRPAYELKYPSDWKPDTEDKDFDLDGYFAIDGPVEDATAIFFIFNVPIDEKKHISTQVKLHLERTIKNGDVSYFENWGNFKGQGATIKGKMLGVFNGEAKIFCHSDKNCSFLSVMQYLDSDREAVMPGFQLIESSFAIKQ